MEIATIPITAHIDRASFTIWSKDDIKKISVKKIIEPKSFEKAGAVSQDGLYSSALGPVKRSDICTTCGLNFFTCPGHYGHIELDVPVFHPMLVQTMYQILSKCCLECFHFRLSQPSLKLFLAQLDALNCGFDHLIEELDDIAGDICRDNKNDGDSYMPIALGKRLLARIEEEKEKTPEFDCQKRPQQRSIVERLSKLFRNFINGHLIKPCKICPNCGERKLNISLFQQSVLIVNSTRPFSFELNDTMKKSDSKGKIKKKKTFLSKKSTSNDLYTLEMNEKKFLTPIGARHCFRLLWKNERHTLQRIFHFLNINESKYEEEKGLSDEAEKDSCDNSKPENLFQPVDLFFIDTILVPPSKFRPPMSQKGYSFEGPRTSSLSNVMKQSIVVQDIIDQMIKEPDETEVEKLQAKLQSNWKNLQVTVNCLYDNEMDKYGKHKYPGLKQLIDKKEGLFRKNMMGKRVNFAARSVISPDPNILVDQIGVPLVFAMKLTYPEPVTPWNIQQLRQAILNGPKEYPGATSVVYDDGLTMSLAKESVRQSIAARLSSTPRIFKGPNKAKPDTPMATIVNRHLLTGDVLLFNRQPTLHKPSIMAFRARVLPNEKGFRLHYANCKSFNADFDGDEMNAHLPQSQLARSEAYNIASVNYQYLVPKDGTPLGGLIQDHVVAVCILTRRDQFFDKERYHQLVYCALSFLERPIKLEQPTILRPTQLWTGKQVITTIIKNCIPNGKTPPTLNIKSKIGPKVLNIQPKYEELSDCHVIIRNGELMKGFMDKSNVGATQYGLIHICYELYGGETSSNLMSSFARLSTLYLQLYEGFTLGIGDILVEDEADKVRDDIIASSLNVGPESAREALNLSGDVSEEKLESKMREAHNSRNPLMMRKLDASMKARTDNIASKISSSCLPEGLVRKFPDNNLQMMIQSGAKGGTVNALQISCLLGQIELEGRRVPLSMSGRSLPSFKPYDTSPRAGGFVSGRFLTGIQPQEFFFHCMAGREGLIDTAVKTSRSGYLQRCLIKHLEGICVHYDQTVRDSCGSVIQFLYGEDGLDIVKSQMLKSKAFSSLIDNYKIIKPSEEELALLNKSKEEYEDDVILRTNAIQQWQEKNGDNRMQKLRGSGFLDFLTSKLSDVKVKIEVHEGSTHSIEHSKVREEPLEDTGSEQVSIQLSASQSRIGSHHHDQIFEAWYALSFKEKKKWNKFWEVCPDPLTAVMNPASHFGVVSEKLDETIENFCKNNPKFIVDTASLFGQEDASVDMESLLACEENPELSKSILSHMRSTAGQRSDQPKLTKHEFYNLCYNLYMKMLAQPGEAVGLLAAQSIGEPSTQMTLNTFHFAGRGDMNVTLGIPRLREILMTAAAKIGTPSMDLPLLAVMKDEFGNKIENQDDIEEQAKRVKLALNAVRLSDVLEYVDITEQVINDSVEPDYAESCSGVKPRAKKRARASLDNERQSKGNQSVQYEIYFNLLPSKYYKHEFKSNSAKVMKFIEEVFVMQLIDSMIKRQKRLLMADSLFNSTDKKLARERTNLKASNGNELEPEQDPEEQELEDFNEKANQKEKVKEDDSSSDEDDEGDGDNTTQRLKSRRNQDLDYEEPEEDDLEVGDMEANAAEIEEGDKEMIADDETEGQPVGMLAAAKVRAVEEKMKKEKRKRKQALSPSELGTIDEEVVVDDELTLQMNEEREQDEQPAGQNFELAGFDETSQTRSGFVTPANELADSPSDQPPASKRKKVDSYPPSTAIKPDHGCKFDETAIVQRINQVKCKSPHVVNYEFDVKHERWCKLTVLVDLTNTRLDMGALIESEAKRTYVHRVGNIQRALIVKDVNARSRGAKCDKMVKTEGVSLLSLVRFNHILDLNAIYSNDIHAIANTYGIEAAGQAIRREMTNVFGVYGIEVDPRHLALIADYMTYNGAIRGMNRMSMEASASPFQQMSFESTLRYLKWASILGLYDDIRSPSASLVFGKTSRGGTGMFSLLQDSMTDSSW